MKEEYKPSPEEVQNAEDMMSDKEKEESDDPGGARYSRRRLHAGRPETPQSSTRQRPAGRSYRY